MRITTTQLRQIIKEEVTKLQEQVEDPEDKALTDFLNVVSESWKNSEVGRVSGRIIWEGQVDDAIADLKEKIKEIVSSIYNKLERGKYKQGQLDVLGIFNNLLKRFGKVSVDELSFGLGMTTDDLISSGDLELSGLEVIDGYVVKKRGIRL